MNKEDILAASRKENKDQDLVELEVKAQAAGWSNFAGMLAICVVLLLSEFLTDTYTLAPTFIYFSMITAQWACRYWRLKKTSSLVIVLLMGALALLSLYGYASQLYE